MAQVVDDREIDKIIQVFTEKVNDCADYIFMKSQENLVKNDSIDTGHLLKTGFVQRAENGPVAYVVYPAPYAEDVEYGQGPHPIKPSELHNWVRRKLEITDKKEIEKVASIIASHINKKGVKPRPFIRPAVEAAKEKFG